MYISACTKKKTNILICKRKTRHMINCDAMSNLRHFVSQN